MKKAILTTIILVLVLSGGIALASDITNATYSGVIQVSNNGTATTNVATVMTLDSQSLIDQDLGEDDFSNVAIRNSSGSDVPFMPSVNSTYPWCLWVPSISGESNLTYTLYTGNASLDSDKYYFPGSGGMATSDDDVSLEPSANFSIEQTGWIDATAGADKYLVHKEAAFRTYVSPTVSGNITTALTEWADSSTWHSPTTAVGATWTEDANVKDGNTASYASHVYGANIWGDYMEMNVASVESMSVRYYSNQVTGTIDEIDIDLYWSGAWHDEYEGAVTHGSWQTVTFDTEPRTVTNSRVRFHCSANPATARFHEFAINETEEVDTLSVTATGISSGEHTVTTNGTANYPAWATGDVLNLDGTNDISVGAVYGAENDFAVSGWFYPTADFSAASPSDLFIVSNWTDLNNNFIVRLKTGNGKLTFVTEDLGATITMSSTATSWSAGVWHHFLAISSSTDGGFLYVDGNLDATDATVTWGLNAGGTLFIGAWKDEEVEFEGVIQNVSTFTDNLTATERSELYQGIVPADAVDYWYMDEGIGTNIPSYGTGANAGTADVGDWITSTYTAGKTGRLCDFTIQVDDDRWGANLKGASVPDNANDWTFCQAAAMPYLEYQEITIGGVQQQYIEWEYATTFTDQSGKGHHATPTFRTTSSDADVSAELISFAPIKQAHSEALPGGTWPTMITDAPEQPTTTYTEESRPGFFFEPVVHTFLDLGGIPDMFFWYNFCFFIIIAAGMVTYRIHPSLIMKCIVMGALMIFFALPGLNVYGMFTFIYFALYCFGIIVISRSQGI